MAKAHGFHVCCSFTGQAVCFCDAHVPTKRQCIKAQPALLELWTRWTRQQQQQQQQQAPPPHGSSPYVEVLVPALYQREVQEDVELQKVTAERAELLSSLPALERAAQTASAKAAKAAALAGLSTPARPNGLAAPSETINDQSRLARLEALELERQRLQSSDAELEEHHQTAARAHRRRREEVQRRLQAAQYVVAAAALKRRNASQDRNHLHANEHVGPSHKGLDAPAGLFDGDDALLGAGPASASGHPGPLSSRQPPSAAADAASDPALSGGSLPGRHTSATAAAHHHRLHAATAPDKQKQGAAKAKVTTSPPGTKAAKSGKAPSKKRRYLTMVDLRNDLSGQQLRLLWPDDGTWWSATVLSHNLEACTAVVFYSSTGDDEDVNLRELVQGREIAWPTEEEAMEMAAAAAVGAAQAALPAAGALNEGPVMSPC